MSRRPAGLATLVLVGLAAGSAYGQISVGENTDRYEAQFGTPVDVSVSDLVNTPTAYEGRAVRTKGQLEMGMSLSRSFTLRDVFGLSIALVPTPDVQGQFETESLVWVGSEVQVTGVFGRGSVSGQGSAQTMGYTVTFWKYVGPPAHNSKSGPIKADSVTLEDLVEKKGKYDGKNVRIVGKFRGRNLFGDLPAKSERESNDWVIKDDLYAVWVTGKKPKGPGWDLDLGMRRDTGKWIEVVGRPETVSGVTYVRALEVVLSTQPNPNADAAPAPLPPPKPKLPPVVVFSLPLDGERDVPSAGVFKIQFSKDMDEDSFKGRVVFRYAGPRLPGDREFVAVKVSYDGGRRALIVDPGDVLRPGRIVELRLLPGIIDIDGLELSSRPGKDPTAATADVLRFQVAASSAFLPER